MAATLDLQTGRRLTYSDPILQKLRHCTNRAVNLVQLTVTAP